MGTRSHEPQWHVNAVHAIRVAKDYQGIEAKHETNAQGNRQTNAAFGR